MTALTVASALVLAACTSDPGGKDDPAAFWPTASGAPWNLEPVASIDGAEALESDGVSVLVPAGWQTRRQETSQLVEIFVGDPEQRIMVTVAITAALGDVGAVEASTAVLLDTAAARGTSELVRHPARWTTWRYATAVTGVVDEEETDFLGVTVLSRSGQIVTVAARAPAGTMDDSLAYQVLRSVKDIG